LGVSYYEFKDNKQIPTFTNDTMLKETKVGRKELAKEGPEKERKKVGNLWKRVLM